MLESIKATARAAALLLAAGLTASASAQSLDPFFTYQGVITDDAGALSGSTFDMSVYIYRTPAGGDYVSARFLSDVPVTEDGLFSVLVDIDNYAIDTQGALYTGEPLYLEITVFDDAGNPHVLSPRQAVTPAPIAQSMPGVYTFDGDLHLGEGLNKVLIGDGVNPLGLSVLNGGICVDTDGDCTPVPGGIRVGLGGLLGTNSTNNNVLINPNGQGFVGIGTDSPTERLDVAGAIRIRGADIVEGFDSSTGEVIEAGTVVSIDPTPGREGRLMPSGEAYDTKVAGVVSGAGGVPYGMALAYDGQFDGDTKVAMTGRVYVKCSAEAGPIRPGDLLTTASLEGHAMKASDRDRAHGTVIGKAMSTLDAETGLVLVLVNLQ